MRRFSFWLILLVLAAGAAGLGWQFLRGPAKAATEAAKEPPPAVPVVAGTAEARDVPITLTGLGAVQAFNTVTVHARVDGQIDRIAFTEGQDVKAGDVLAQIDPRPFQAQLAQAQATKARDEAQLANARRDLARFTSLVQRDFASRQSVDTQQAAVAQLEAAVQGDQAQIDNAKVQLGYTTIVAPIGGRTGVRLIDQGNIVRAGDSTGIVVITQVQPISVLFTLPQDVLDDVVGAMKEAASRGGPAVQVYKRDDKTQLGEGTLSLIDNQIDPGAGTIRLKATFPNADGRLWPGEFVNARLLLTTRRNAVTVPAQVVQRGLQGTFCYVIKTDQTVEIRPIKVGQTREGVAVIEDGLAAGERIVVDGQYKLKPGTRVETGAPGGKSPDGRTS